MELIELLEELDRSLPPNDEMPALQKIVLFRKGDVLDELCKGRTCAISRGMLRLIIEELKNGHQR